MLTGSECTGKTTLAARLAEHYGTVFVPEQSRAYLEAKGAPLTYADVEPIARAVLAAEDELAPQAQRLLVLDTDLVSTLVYGRHYYGDCPPWVAAATRARPRHLYLLHHPDVPWVADGDKRDRPHQRGLMHALFRRALEDSSLPYVDIRGGWKEREERARQAIDTLLSRPLPSWA